MKHSEKSKNRKKAGKKVRKPYSPAAACNVNSTIAAHGVGNVIVDGSAAPTTVGKSARLPVDLGLGAEQCAQVVMKLVGFVNSPSSSKLEALQLPLQHLGLVWKHGFNPKPWFRGRNHGFVLSHPWVVFGLHFWDYETI